ncbi:response regulator transcription factor [Paenibacillus silvisoli]|uniref:response regulator transcription factor n=1 Tax=Paenibacillus silvisoli TaxID=3110539 RepID=UPI0028042BB9|nr:response regulator [Paenibacillus silvisoli]
MHDILVVDDEPAAIKSLIYLLDWEKYGFEIAATANNGEAALRLMETQSFSLIITDIRMPVMDGLSFIAKVRQMSDIPVMILSGYEDFDYAKRGMKMGVKDYLLKPVEADELADKLLEIKNELLQKELLHKKLRQGLPMMRDQLLKHWAHGYVEDFSSFEHLELQISDGQPRAYCLMLLELKQADRATAPIQEMKIRRFAVRNVVEEACGGFGYVFEETDLRYGIIVFENGKPLHADYMLWIAEMVKDCVRRFTKEAVTISIGPNVSSFHDLVYSYLSAVKSLDGRAGASGGNGEGSSIIVGASVAWNKDQRSQQVIDEVKQLVQQQYSRSINLRSIAGQVFLNPVYLGQLFKVNEGITFNQHLLQVRMEQAKELLLHTDMKIYEIAGKVGYREIDWFSKKFKEYTGISAGEYRQQVAKGNGQVYTTRRD